MLLDLVSQSNYFSYNVSIANLLGLDIAVYLNLILDINSKAIKKKKISDCFFTVDRDYIKNITTIDVDKQEEIDKKLIKLGILEIDTKNSNIIKLNLSNLTSIVMSSDENLVSDITKIIKKKETKKTKKESQIDYLKSFINTDNPELRDAYSDWIESVIAKQNWMSKRSVISGQAVVDRESNRNLDIALAIINIGAINGYRDMEWAVSKYKDNYNISYKTSFNSENIKSAKTDINFTGEVF